MLGKVSDLDKFHLRSEMNKFNKDLGTIEEEIIRQMRQCGPNCEFVECLIGERENIKYRLGEIHRQLYHEDGYYRKY
jgi:hypothetical protein